MVDSIEGHVRNEKRAPCCLGYIADYLPSYVGIIVNCYKDPYKTTGIMESNSCFFFSSLKYFGAWVCSKISTQIHSAVWPSHQDIAGDADAEDEAGSDG